MTTIATPRICDVTLRDGEQAVDAAFTSDEKLDLVMALDALGVDEIQLGFTSDANLVARARDAGAKVPIQLLAPAFTDDWQDRLAHAAESQANLVAVLVRSSDRHLELLGWGRRQALERAKAATEYVIERGGAAALTLSFATVAPPDFVAELAAAAVEAGTSRIVIADSTGRGTPRSVGELVEKVCSACTVPVGIHCHNDFGLAVANTLAGLEAGATWAEVALNGIGERAGNASLEAVVMSLVSLYGVEVSVDTRRLAETCQRVATVLKQSVASNGPVVGEYAFAQKLDLHVEGSVVAPELFEPFDPSLAGNRRSLRVGKGSGAFAVRAKLEELGVSVSDVTLRAAVEFANREADRSKRAVTDAALVRSIGPGEAT